MSRHDPAVFVTLTKCGHACSRRRFEAQHTEKIERSSRARLRELRRAHRSTLSDDYLLHLRQLFLRLDEDRSGYITNSEFEAAVTASEPSRAAPHAAAALVHNLCISVAESLSTATVTKQPRRGGIPSLRTTTGPYYRG